MKSSTNHVCLICSSERCSLTLLPLTHFGLQTCGGCGRSITLFSSTKASTPDENEASDQDEDEDEDEGEGEDEDERILKRELKTFENSIIASTLLDPNLLDICIYCGCRYTR